MIQFTILKPQAGGPEAWDCEAEAPTLPRPGDYISHDQTGISGTVQRVQFWWDDRGDLSMEVRLEPGLTP